MRLVKYEAFIDGLAKVVKHPKYAEVFRNLSSSHVSETIEATQGVTAGVVVIKSESHRAGFKAMMSHPYYNGGFSEKLGLERPQSANAVNIQDLNSHDALGVDYDFGMVFDPEQASFEDGFKGLVCGSVTALHPLGRMTLVTDIQVIE
jgi:hypothetical protein